MNIPVEFHLQPVRGADACLEVAEAVHDDDAAAAAWLLGPPRAAAVAATTCLRRHHAALLQFTECCCLYSLYSAAGVYNSTLL